MLALGILCVYLLACTPLVRFLLLSPSLRGRPHPSGARPFHPIALVLGVAVEAALEMLAAVMTVRVIAPFQPGS